MKTLSKKYKTYIIAIIWRGRLQDYFFGRNQMVYLPEILQEDGRHIIENHNPMTDNPFLVVYKFRE